MTRSLVVITDSDLPHDGGARQLLEDAGLRVREETCKTAAEVIRVASEADALIVQWAPISGAVLDAAPRCRVVSRLGIGCDMIDVDAATSRGVAVLNTPDYCVEEVALHTVAAAFAGVRCILELDRAVRSGRWDGPAVAARTIRASETTAAVIGFGRIGRHVAATLAAAGFDVVVSDPYVDAREIERHGYRSSSLDTALAEAHLVTLHAPLTAETQHLLSRDRLARTRRGAYVVNTCRGALIDEDALVDALCEGHLGGAALDVFEHEPLPPTSRLREAPNLLLSPHAAWYSPSALLELPRHAARNVIDFLTHGTAASIVNPGFAQVSRRSAGPA